MDQKVLQKQVELNGLITQIRDKTSTRFDQIETELARMKTPGLRSGISDEAKSAEYKAFGAWFRKGIVPPEQKTLTVGSDPSFGYACPPELSSEIVHSLTEGSPMRQLARIYQTDKNSLEVLKKSASGAVVLQSSEVGEILETTGLAYAKLTYTPKTEVYLLKASVINLEDAAFPLEAEISQELGEAFAYYEAAAHITGTEGLIANIGDGTLNTYDHTHMGSTTDISADKIIGLTYAIPTRYLPNASFLMNRTTAAAVRQLKDAVTGAYLWQSLLTGGDRDRLCGFPVHIVDNMPAPTSGLYPIGFGDWSKAFAIVDRYPNFTVQRLDQAFAVYGIIGYLARFRTTSGPLDGAAAHFLEMSS